MSDEITADPWLQVLLPAQASNGSDTSVDPQLLKMALAPYPKLKVALFPAGPRGQGLMSDTSLYQLLQVQPPAPPLFQSAVSCPFCFLFSVSCFFVFLPPVFAPAGLFQTVWLADGKHAKLHR